MDTRIQYYRSLYEANRARAAEQPYPEIRAELRASTALASPPPSEASRKADNFAEDYIFPWAGAVSHASKKLKDMFAKPLGFLDAYTGLRDFGVAVKKDLNDHGKFTKDTLKAATKITVRNIANGAIAAVSLPTIAMMTGVGLVAGPVGGIVGAGLAVGGISYAFNTIPEAVGDRAASMVDWLDGQAQSWGHKLHDIYSNRSSGGGW